MLPARFHTLLCALVIAYFAAIITAFAGLIPLGYWHDEYATFAALRAGGWHYFVSFMVGWVPRPFSDLLVLLYGWLALNLHRELAGSALVPVWLLLFACTVLPPFFFFRRADVAAKAGIGALAMALMCSFLLGHPVAEAFYWPMAAFAYLPTLGAVTLLLWSFCAGGAERPRLNLLRGTALLIGAWSSEIGAVFALVFAGLGLTMPMAYGLLHGRRPSWAAVKPWLAVPLLGALWLLYKVATGRATNAHEGDGYGNDAIRHHALNSLMASGPGFNNEMFSPSSDSLSSLAIKLLFLLGAYLTLSLLPRKPADRAAAWYLAAIVIAAIATFFVTIAAAFFQYGMDCCEHHETTRQDLVFIALIATAAVPVVLGHGLPRWHRRGGIAALVCLVLAVTIPMDTAGPQLVSDYLNYDTIRATKAANWRTGLSPAADMTFLVPAPGQITGGLSDVSGTYTNPDIPGMQRASNAFLQLGVLQYFNKQSITFVAASQPLPLSQVGPLLRLIGISRFAPIHPSSTTPSPSGACSLNPIGNQPLTPAPIISASYVVPLSGWALMNGLGHLPATVLITLHGPNGDFAAQAKTGGLRTDVTAYFHLPAKLNHSGFHADTDLSAVPDGQYQLSIHTQRASLTQTCGAFPITVTHRP